MTIEIEKIKACLLGGAIGDSFGAPVEFDSLEEIKNKYGASGITFSNYSQKPLITDDTQMTLFTANGLIIEGNTLDNIWWCYKDWLETQFKADKTEMSHKPVSWLVNEKEMFASREPGRTCLFEIAKDHRGTFAKRYNDSKGCGAIMRTAPIGLIRNSEENITELSANVSMLTHGNPISAIACVYFSSLIHLLVYRNFSILEAIHQVNELIKDAISPEMGTKIVLNEVKLAISLSELNEPDVECIKKLGEGWIAEETLEIAIFCALKYKKNFKKAIEVSVNHDGDSDSTGNLVGQILGAKYGTDILPVNYLSHLELRTVIEKIAQQLAEK